MSAIESQAKALTGAVTIAGIGLIVVASSWLDWILILALLAMGEAQRRRNDYALEDCVACLLDWGTEAIHLVNQGIGETLRLEQARSRLVSAAVNQLPMGEQIAAMFDKRELSSDVLPQLLRRCSFVVGESGDGKTHVLHWLAQEFIRNNPNGEILIGDPNYGSGHGGKVMDWSGLPLGRVIQTDPSDIYQMVMLTHAKLKERVARAKDGIKHPPLLMLIDEWTTLVPDWSNNQVESLLNWLRVINREGIKQNVVAVIGTHSLAKTEASFPQGFLRDWQALFLWGASRQPDNYGNLNAPAYRVKEVVEQMQQAPRFAGGQYSAVAYISKQFEVVGIPDLELSNQPVEAPEDEARLWADEWRSRLDEELEVTGKLTFTRAWEITGENSALRRNDNPRYLAIKGIVAELKQPREATATDS